MMDRFTIFMVRKQSFADMFKNPSGSKAARLNHMTSEHVAGANVAIPMSAVKDVSDRFENTLYGYFIGKRLAFPVVENYVKNAWKKFGLERVMLTHGFFMFQFATKDGMDRVLEEGPWLIRLVPLFLNIWTPNTRLEKGTITSAPVWVKLYNVPIVAFSEIGLSLITSQLGKPIMLDAYTSSMCQKSWGRNEYARALVEVSALTPLLDSVVVCPKIMKVADSQKEVDDDGFTKVSSKNDKGKNKGKNRQVAGIRLTKPSPNYVQQGRQPVSVDKDINLVEIRNSFDSLMEKDKVLDVTESQSSQTHNDSLNEDDDDEEVEDIYVEPDPKIRKQQVLSNIGASTPTDSVLNA
ncbi:zinc knuckle CX2CX4HX4C containing protein [Tanacetum coccineum]